MEKLKKAIIAYPVSVQNLDLISWGINSFLPRRRGHAAGDFLYLAEDFHYAVWAEDGAGSFSFCSAALFSSMFRAAFFISFDAER